MPEWLGSMLPGWPEAAASLSATSSTLPVLLVFWCHSVLLVLLPPLLGMVDRGPPLAVRGLLQAMAGTVSLLIQQATPGRMAHHTPHTPYKYHTYKTHNTTHKHTTAPTVKPYTHTKHSRRHTYTHSYHPNSDSTHSYHIYKIYPTFAHPVHPVHPTPQYTHHTLYTYHMCWQSLCQLEPSENQLRRGNPN